MATAPRPLLKKLEKIMADAQKRSQNAMEQAKQAEQTEQKETSEQVLKIYFKFDTHRGIRQFPKRESQWQPLCRHYPDRR